MAKCKWRPSGTKDIFKYLYDGAIVYAVDTETTGLEPETSQIIEIGMLKLEYHDNNFTILDEKDIFIKPDIPVTDEITKITSITNEMLEDKPLEKEAFLEILEFLGTSPIFMAYNSPFDVGMVSSLYKRQGYNFKPELEIDALAMAYDVIPNTKVNSHQLGKIYTYLLGTEDVQFHLAINDIKATVKVVNLMIPLYDKFEYVAAGLAKPRLFATWYWDAGDKNHNLKAVYFRTESGTISLNETGHYFVDKDEGVVKFVDCEYLLKEAMRREGLTYTTFDTSIREFLYKMKAKDTINQVNQHMKKYGMKLEDTLKALHISEKRYNESLEKIS